MVRVSVRQGQEVEPSYALLPQERRHDAHANIEAAIVCATAIDEDIMVAGGLDHNGVPGTNIEKGDTKLVRARSKILPPYSGTKESGTDPGIGEAPADAGRVQGEYEESVVSDQAENGQCGGVKLRSGKVGNVLHHAYDGRYQPCKGGEDDGCECRAEEGETGADDTGW